MQRKVSKESMGFFKPPCENQINDEQVSEIPGLKFMKIILGRL